MRVAFITVFAVAVCGCRPIPHLVQESRDSVIVREVLRDTVIRIEADSSLIEALVECDSLGQARLSRIMEYESGGRVTPPSVTITDNVLTAKAVVDSMEVYMTLKDRYEEHRVGIVRTVEVNRPTAWQKVRMRLGEAAIAVISVLLLLGVARVARWF